MENMDRLVIFTAHYPYTSGESFLEDEMKYVADIFQEIVIVTAEKRPTADRYFLPPQARVVESRKGMRKHIGLLLAAVHMFHPKTIADVCKGIRAHGWRKLVSILKKTLITEKAIACMMMVKHEWYSERPSIYYAYWLDSEATGLARIRSQLNGHCIARTHGGDCFFDREYHPYRMLQLSKLDAIYPISIAGREDILCHYQVDGLEEKVQTIYLGVTYPSLANPWMKKAEVTVVSCAEVKQLKRIDLLIDALSELDAPIHWIHYGDGEMMEQIQTYAKDRLFGNKKIRYEFRGRVLKSEILDFYASTSIDVFVNTSDSEGIPVSIMEAMAYGIPIVAKDVGGVAELMDNTCGLLLPKTAGASDIARSIETIVHMSDKERETMRLAERNRIAEHFTAQTNFDRMHRRHQHQSE